MSLQMSSESGSGFDSDSLSDTKSDESTSDAMEPVRFSSEYAMRKYQQANLLLPDPLLLPCEKYLLKIPSNEKEWKAQSAVMQELEPARLQLQAYAIGYEQQPIGLLAFCVDANAKMLRCQRCGLLAARAVHFYACECLVCVYCALESPDFAALRDRRFLHKCPVCNSEAYQGYNADFSDNLQLSYVAYRFYHIFHEYKAEKPDNCAVCGTEVKDEKVKRQFSDDNVVQKSTNKCVVCARSYCNKCRPKAIALPALTEKDLTLACQHFTAANPTEQKFIETYRSRFCIFQDFLVDLKKHYFLPIKFSFKCIDYDDICCPRCVACVYNAALCWERSKIADPTREECYFGFCCKDQLLDMQHQTKFSHGYQGSKGDGALQAFW